MQLRSQTRYLRFLALLLTPVLLAAAPATASAQQDAVPVVFKNHTNAPLRVEIVSVVDTAGNTVPLNGVWDLPANFFGYLTTAQGKVYAKTVHFRVIGPKKSSYWTSKLQQVDKDGDFVVYFSAANYQEHLRLVGGGQAPQVPNADKANRRKTLDAQIADLAWVVNKGQQNLNDLNAKIFVADGALFLAELADNNPKNNKFLTGSAVVIARGVLNGLIADRNRVQSNLNANRSRYNQLRNERDSLERLTKGKRRLTELFLNYNSVSLRFPEEKACPGLGSE